MSDFDPTADELIFSHRYAEALALCNADIEAGRDSLAAYDNRARALLCLGRAQESLDDTVIVEAESLQHKDIRSARYLNKRCTLNWLLGRRDEAIDLVSLATQGVRNGTLNFGDLAGGVSQGLLLYFAAVSESDKLKIQEAASYLSWLAKKKTISNWPGPVALYLLGQADAPELFLQNFGTGDLESALISAKSDLLKKRHLVQALFYLGIACRAVGDEASCRAYLEMCCGIENPIIENEWYLAHHELGRRWY